MFFRWLTKTKSVSAATVFNMEANCIEAAGNIVNDAEVEYILV